MQVNPITGQIGNTPLIAPQRLLQKEGVQLLLKLEGNNPGGSVKDRAASVSYTHLTLPTKA